MATWLIAKDGTPIDLERNLMRRIVKSNLAYVVEKATRRKIGYYLEHREEWMELLNTDPYVKSLYDIAMKYCTYECNWDCRVCKWMKGVKDSDGVEVMKCRLIDDYGITLLNADELEEDPDELEFGYDEEE